MGWRLWLASRLLDLATAAWPRTKPDVRTVSDGWLEDDPAKAASLMLLARRRAILDWWHAVHPGCMQHPELTIKRNPAEDGWTGRCDQCGAEASVSDMELRC